LEGNEMLELKKKSPFQMLGVFARKNIARHVKDNHASLRRDLIEDKSGDRKTVPCPKLGRV